MSRRAEWTARARDFGFAFSASAAILSLAVASGCAITHAIGLAFRAFGLWAIPAVLVVALAAMAGVSFAGHEAKERAEQRRKDGAK